MAVTGAVLSVWFGGGGREGRLFTSPTVESESTKNTEKNKQTKLLTCNNSKGIICLVT